MRDQLHDRPVVFWLATATLLLGVAAWLVLAIMAGAWLSAIGAFIVNDFLFMLLAHLIWGSKIRYGQQERPEYIEKEH